MKMLRIALAAFLLAATPALAQQTAIHSIPIGKGGGNTGFNAAVPGTAGQPLISNGPSADPGFGVIANSGLTPGAANTFKGSLDGVSVTDQPLPPCTSVSQALRWTAGVGFSCGNIGVTTGYDMPINLGLSVPAPSGSALTITLTQAGGSAPNASNPVLVPFRSTALATGTVLWTTISATQSIVIPSGATLGTSSANVPFRLWIFEDYNGGTPQLGVATCSNPTTVFGCSAWESTLKNSVAITSGATSGGVLYANSSVTADAIRIIGYCEFASGLTTAGTWATACTTLQVFGPGVPKPGAEVQRVQGTSTSGQAITPTSAANLIDVSATTTGTAVAASGTMTLKRGSTSLTQQSYNGSTVNDLAWVMLFMDAPGTASSTTYSLVGLNFNVTNPIFILKEIMG